MTIVVAIYLLLLAIVVVALIFRDYNRGTCELLSVRNAALAGFVVFQLTSGGVALLTGNHGRIRLTEPGWTSIQFAAMATVFLVILLWVYRRGWVATPLARRVPMTWASPQSSVLLTMAIIVTILAVGLRFGVRIPLIGILTGYLGTGLAAVACGLVGWVWGRQLLNPIFVAYSGVIVAANTAVVMVGVFGRRGLVAVGGALLWGMYYSHWRHLAVSSLLGRLAAVGIVPLLILALFSSARESSEHDRTLLEHIQEIRTQGNVKEGLQLLAYGQYAGSISMWLIENYPDRFEHRHLMSIWHFLVFPVPRDWWPGKPITLGEQVPKQAAWSGIGRYLTVGPGIVGHAAAEGGWYALVVYAVLGGMFLRFFDEIIRLNPNSPFVVLAVGCALGQIMGLARGTTSAFAAICVLTVSSAFLTMVFVGKFVELAGWGQQNGPDDDGDDREYDDDAYWDPEYGSGYDEPYADESSARGEEM
jgi:hypothetical protein